jgi:ADP-ribose pyrophosphatase YjhB (NUDIX family)
MPAETEILARGPWEARDVDARWHDEHFEPAEAAVSAADEAIAALRERGSPSHDGLSARLTRYDASDGRLVVELQPTRWALRLIPGDAQDSVAAICVTRSADGRWLAGRRAAWLSTLPGHWTLGAGGAVDVHENPVDTLGRELVEEWSVTPERLTAEALIRLPHRLILFIGMAWLPDGAEVTPDHEHDAHAWWPADVERWPDEAAEPLRAVGRILGSESA